MNSVFDNSGVSFGEEENYKSSKERFSESDKKKLPEVLDLFGGLGGFNADKFMNKTESKAKSVVKVIDIVCGYCDELNEDIRDLLEHINGIEGFLEDHVYCLVNGEKVWYKTFAFAKFQGLSTCIGYINLRRDYAIRKLMHLSPDNRLNIIFDHYKITESGRVILYAQYTLNREETEEPTLNHAAVFQQQEKSLFDSLFIHDIKDAILRRDEQRLTTARPSIVSAIAHGGKDASILVPLLQEVTACLESIDEEKKRNQGGFNYTHIEHLSRDININQVNMEGGRIIK